MKITVLAENTTCRDDCRCEHGLSLHIEHNGARILFDAGQTDVFARNAAALGVELARVDYAVLSHGHYDHGGGIVRFLQENDHAPVYLSGYAFDCCYSGGDRYIGLAPELKGNPRLRTLNGPLRLSPGAMLVPWGEYPEPHPSYGRGLSVLENGVHRPDSFRHEQYLQLDCGGRRVLVSGCSHKGIVNIMERFCPDVLVGGFHFMKLAVDGEDRSELVRMAELLRGFSAEYYTCHCTGTEQYDVLSPLMGSCLHYISAGTVFEI